MIVFKIVTVIMSVVVVSTLVEGNPVNSEFADYFVIFPMKAEDKSVVQKREANAFNNDGNAFIVGPGDLTKANHYWTRKRGRDPNSNSNNDNDATNLPNPPRAPAPLPQAYSSFYNFFRNKRQIVNRFPDMEQDRQHFLLHFGHVDSSYRQPEQEWVRERNSDVLKFNR